MSGQRESEAARYRESCRKAFWRQVLYARRRRISRRATQGISGDLSEGCGPAGVEAELIR